MVTKCYKESDSINSSSLSRHILDGENDARIDGYKNRLALALGTESARSFALRAKISPTGIRQHLKGDSLPTLDTLLATADAAKVNLLWLATGEGPMRPDDQINDRSGTYDKGEYAYIPLYDVEVSAGGGSLNDHEQVIARMAFLRSWLNKIGLHEKDLSAVRAHGDSMEPTITEGDMLLVDKSQRRPGGGHIYIMCVQGALVVKRLSVDPDGRVRVISDNKIYPEATAALDQLDIVGRVVWAGGLL